MDIRVEYNRDGLTEEFHEGFLERLGLPAEDKNVYYLRSCAKPLQASLLIDNNAGLEEDELALICGSHAGEDCHIEIARRILKRFDIAENLLKCGIHAPLSRTMQNKMLINGEKPGAIHNNCSGKHIGFLVLCKLNGWDMETYYKPEHPLQKAVKDKINELCEINNIYPETTDGCGVPILSMPLYNMLKGYENLISNYPDIIRAIKHNPYIYGGEGRIETEITGSCENLIAKAGAGGLCIVMNIKDKDGFVVKINDCSMEARRFTVLETINRLGWDNIEYDNKIRTIQGKVVGEICVKYHNGAFALQK